MEEEKAYEDVQKAFQDVISIFTKFDEAQRCKLLQLIATFFEINQLSDSIVHQPRQITSNHSEKIIPSFTEDRSMSPKEFILDKLPRSDVEKVACLAYYLTHYRDLPHFKTVDISKLNTEAAQRKFSNPNQSTKNALNYGYLAPATKGYRQLSAAGEMFVEKLPDRAAAKDAMTHFRPRKRTVSQKKQPTDKTK